MIDANAFFLMLLCILGSILIVALIVLVMKLIFTVDRVNKMLDDVEVKVSKLDKMFDIVDVITDNMSLLSDKIVDTISNLIRKLFNRNGKEEITDEKE